MCFLELSVPTHNCVCNIGAQHHKFSKPKSMRSTRPINPPTEPPTCCAPCKSLLTYRFISSFNSLTREVS